MKQSSAKEVSGWLRAEGSKLLNGDGKEILLRGVGLGSWLLPEGYMWRFPEQGDRPRRMEQMITELIGPKKASRFWETYFNRYITEADIRQIAAEGFNSVRVPINARILIAGTDPLRYDETRLMLIDRVVGWCRDHRLYVILDLHGAPGGQTGTNIDDSENNQPELFIHESFRRQTIELWRMLAERYKNEWIVAGYDLLNEPLPDWFSAYYPLVMPLYKDIVKAIREVDPRHLIILEGVHWSTDWSIFDEKIDDLLMLQFHKYWSNPDTESIQSYLDKRGEWDVPIFMGEGGENNLEWYTGAFRLYEEQGISWNFWTWKKMNTINSPCSIVMPDGWHLLAGYLEGGAKPDAGTAERILWEYLDNLPLERCQYHPEVVRALFRQASVRIPAIFYGSKGAGGSYGIRESRSEGRSEGGVGFRVSDGTEILFAQASPGKKADFRHHGGAEWAPEDWLCVRLEAGEWLAYDFAVREVAGDQTDPEFDVREVAGSDTARTKAEWTKEYGLSLFLLAEAEHEYAAGSGVSVEIDGAALGSISPGRAGAWEMAKLGRRLTLAPGEHRIVLKAEARPVRLQWLSVTESPR